MVSGTKRILSPDSGVNETPQKKLKLNEEGTSDVPRYGAKTGKKTWWELKRKSLRQNIVTADNRVKKNDAQIKYSNNTKEPVNWKELKERKKTLKQTRRQKRFSGKEIISEAKRLYEIVKKRSKPKKDRDVIVSKIYDLLRGHLKAIIYKHDMTRIAQLLVKLSPESVRKSIWSELKPEVPKMLLSKYAIHTVRSILDVGGSDVRREFTASLRGNVLIFLKNKVAAPLIDRVYKNYASPEDRSLVRQELTHFTRKNTISTLLETVERKGCFCPYSSESKFIQNLVEEIKHGEDPLLMISLKCTLEMLIEKDLVENSLVQSVMCDYLMKCNPTDREQFMSTLQPILQKILDKGLNSFYAVLLFVEYLWLGSNKEKKWIVKKLHGKMPHICFQNHNYFLIMAVLESVDDTVLLKKTLLKDIKENIKQFADSTYGWKVLMHILTPRNPQHFSTSYVSLLRVGDTTALKKKSDVVRNAEILEPVIDPLLEDIARDTSYWLCNGHGAILTKEAICVGKGARIENVLEAIADFVCCEKPEFLDSNGPEFNRQVEWLVKQLIKTDVKRDGKDEVTFSSLFLSKVEEDEVQLWVQGRAGAIIFVKLIETGIPSIQRNVKSLIKSEFKKLIDSSPAGDLLRNKLQEMESQQHVE